MNSMPAAYAVNARQSRTPDRRGRSAPELLAVVAADVADAVNAAGGLIFDRVSAGWRVAVYLESPGDDRPLRILGAGAHPLPGDSRNEPQWPDILLVAADVHERNTAARRFVAAACRSHGTKVAVWSEIRSSDTPTGIGWMDHRLSAAAQAFKVHAVRAAGLMPPVSLTESFRRRER